MPLIRKGWAMSQGRWGGQVRTSRVGRKGSKRGKRMAEVRGSSKKCKQASKEREGDPEGGKRHR